MKEKVAAIDEDSFTYLIGSFSPMDGLEISEVVLGSDPEVHWVTNMSVSEAHNLRDWLSLKLSDSH